MKPSVVVGLIKTVKVAAAAVLRVPGVNATSKGIPALISRVMAVLSRLISMVLAPIKVLIMSRARIDSSVLLEFGTRIPPTIFYVNS